MLNIISIFCLHFFIWSIASNDLFTESWATTYNVHVCVRMLFLFVLLKGWCDRILFLFQWCWFCARACRLCVCVCVCVFSLFLLASQKLLWVLCVVALAFSSSFGVVVVAGHTRVVVRLHSYKGKKYETERRRRRRRRREKGSFPLTVFLSFYPITITNIHFLSISFNIFFHHDNEEFYIKKHILFVLLHVFKLFYKFVLK